MNRIDLLLSGKMGYIFSFLPVNAHSGSHSREKW